MTEPDSFLSEVDGQTVLIHNRGGARRQDAEQYAQRFGVSLEDAFFRLDLQESVGKLRATLIEKEAATFGGIFIQHEPEYHVIVQFTESAAETLSAYLSENTLVDVAYIFEARAVSHTLSMLEEHQQFLANVLANLDIHHASHLNEKENQITIEVLDLNELENALANIDFVLSDFVEVKQVESLGNREVNIYGGMEAILHCANGIYPSDTTGPNLVNSSGTVFASTAGHACSGTVDEYMTINGVNYPFIGQALTNDFDFQWHSIPSGVNPSLRCPQSLTPPG